jgi:hypothetical protein
MHCDATLGLYLPGRGWSQQTPDLTALMGTLVGTQAGERLAEILDEPESLTARLGWAYGPS